MNGCTVFTSGSPGHRGKTTMKLKVSVGGEGGFKIKLTFQRCFHPGEGDPADDALAEAQQEGAALLFLQQQLLLAFAHEAHDVAEQTRGAVKPSHFSRDRPDAITTLERAPGDAPFPPEVLQEGLHHHQDAIKPHPESVGRVFLQNTPPTQRHQSFTLPRAQQ